MKKDIEYCTSDKTKWSKEHFLSVEQRNKLIEDKIKRALKIVELENKTKELLK